MLAGKDGRVLHHYKIANIVATEGAHLANFDAAKFAHLQALTPEERADIAFVMDARDMSLALKDMRPTAPRGPPSPTSRSPRSSSPPGAS